MIEHIQEKPRQDLLEHRIAQLVSEKISHRGGGENVSREIPLGTVGLTTIQLCDLTVDLEDLYHITIREEPEKMALWSIKDLTRNIRNTLFQKSSRKPNWKDSFESLVFSGQVKALRTPLSVHLDMTFRCNMRCVFCYDSSGNPRHSEEMTTEEVQRVLDECCELDVVDITFGGGEPFIREDFIPILACAKERGLKLFILTNGTCITPEIAKKLVPILDLRYDKIQVSLDGPVAAIHDKQRGIPGAFDQTIWGIKHLQEVGITPTINSVLTRYNYASIPDMIPFLMEHGLNSYRVLRLHPLGRAQESHFYRQWQIAPQESELLFDFLEKKRWELIGEFSIADDNASIFPWSSARIRERSSALPGKEPQSYACGAGTTRLSIAADGSIFPCSYLYEFPELQVGSIRNHTIKEIWDNEAVWKPYREPLVPQGKCQHCEYLFHCKTGCRALSYAVYGEMDAPDPGCSYKSSGIMPQKQRKGKHE